MAESMQMIAKEAKLLGVSFEPIYNRPLEKGELYLAHRRGKVKLLTCHMDDRENGWVMPMELDYPYDTHECFRVLQ